MLKGIIKGSMTQEICPVVINFPRTTLLVTMSILHCPRFLNEKSFNIMIDLTKTVKFDISTPPFR